MDNNQHYERENIELRVKYDEGLLSSEDFLSKLFNSEKADRLRQAIVAENDKMNNEV